MSTERKPLLSNDDLELARDEWANGGVNAAYWVRDHYEGLITEGKLRVLEEVGYLGKHGLQRNCTSCDHLSQPSDAKWWTYCPGCGNKIKR